MGGFAWVTLATNDSYSLGALVLGHALKQAGTIGQLVVLVTPGVTLSMRAKLSAVFNVVQEVNILDSKDEANLRLLKRPELGVTFTKLHCWRLTQFDKCVFLDADTLVLSNCDELFQREELSAAPDVGWPDCFNSGVFVFKPSNDTYETLIKFALENGSFDGGDQGLLNLFYSDWAHKDISKRLPFIYNMCSIASYSYLPAFRQFGGQVKIIHFIGVTKPWLQYFDTESKQVQPAAGTEHLKQHLQLWWNIFCAQVHPSLTPDMFSAAQKNSSDKRPDQSTSPINTSSECHFTYPTVIPDPWLNYRKTDSDKSDQIKPDESHNTNSHKNEDVFDLESVQVMISPSSPHVDLIIDDALYDDSTDTTDLDLDSAIDNDITDEFSANTPTKDTNESLADHVSIPDTNNKTATLLPSSSGENITEDNPDLLPDGNREEGLASAFAQFTLGSRRSENQSALEDHLRRQCWEVGNIDYLGRDSFSNIWNKISETMAGSAPKTEPKEGQAIPQKEFATIAAPKPISSSEIPVSAKPDPVQTLEQPAASNLKQTQPIPIAVKPQELIIDGPPVTLKDILQPTQPLAPLVCEKAPAPISAAAEIKAAPICEIKLAEAKAAPVCEAIPAEKASPVCEAKQPAIPIPTPPAENIQQSSVLLAEVVTTPPDVGVCVKPTAAPETSAPICQKPEVVCAKAVPICEKPAPVCDKSTKEAEKQTADKSVPVAEQKVAAVSDIVSAPTAVPITPSLLSTVNVPPASAAIPLEPPAKVETKSTPTPIVEPTSSPTPSGTGQPQGKAQDKAASPPKAIEPIAPVIQAVTGGPAEKAQELKPEIPSSAPPALDTDGKNNKHNKKNNKNGKQDGKPQQQQQQQSKGEKGKNNKSKPTGDVSTIVVKTEEKPITPVPISELPKQEPEIKPTVVSCPLVEKVEEAKKESPIPAPTEQKPTEQPVKVSESPTQQDKTKKHDKQKKDSAHGEKKEQQKPDNANNNQDKKKPADKQEQSDGKKDIVQKPEQQGQNKNAKKGNNKGDNKAKKDGDQKPDEKVEQKSECTAEQKPQPAVEAKPISKPETKPEQKTEVKKAEEKVESKPQQKAENVAKPGKDPKPDDKKKGAKEQKSTASPPKEKDQPPAPKQEAIVPPAAVAPTAPVVAPLAAAVAPTASAVASTASAPVLEPETPKAVVEQTATAPAEQPSSPSQQKEPSNIGKKEPAPTPPPRKGNNGSKKGKKK